MNLWSLGKVLKKNERYPQRFRAVGVVNGFALPAVFSEPGSIETFPE